MKTESQMSAIVVACIVFSLAVVQTYRSLYPYYKGYRDYEKPVAQLHRWDKSDKYYIFIGYSARRVMVDSTTHNTVY